MGLAMLDDIGISNGTPSAPHFRQLARGLLLQKLHQPMSATQTTPVAYRARRLLPPEIASTCKRHHMHGGSGMWAVWVCAALYDLLTCVHVPAHPCASLSRRGILSELRMPRGP